MKTRILYIALALILAGLMTINAEGKKVKSEKLETSYLVESVELNLEEELAIENWMAELNFSADFLVTESEAELDIEEWMYMEMETVEAEEELEIEDWMLDGFNVTSLFEVEEEPELEIEDWMLKF